MLEDIVENEFISCKIIRKYFKNNNIVDILSKIKVECVLKESHMGRYVYYYAANTPDRLLSFNGSGLPFSNREAAYEGTPNIGRLDIKDNKFTIELLTPNSYYDKDFNLVEPEVIIRYMTLDKKTRVLHIPVDNKIPYRNLLYNKNDVRIYDKIQTQEKNLLKNSYPKI